MSLPCNSKDLNYCPSSALPQNLDKNINSFHIPCSNNLADLNNVNKEFLPKIPHKKSTQKNPPKKSSQKISPKKFLPRNSSQKNPPKKIPPKNSSKEIPSKKSS